MTSYMVAAQLLFYANAKSRFSHDVAQMTFDIKRNMLEGFALLMFMVYIN